MEELIRKFILFGTIGLANSLLDTAIWKTLIVLFKKNKMVNDVLRLFKLNIFSGAQVISFIFAVSSSFYLNSKYTWAMNPFESQYRAISYFVVSVCAWFATVLFINVLTSDKMIEKYESSFYKLKHELLFSKFLLEKFDYPLLIKLLSIFLSMVINFVGYNYLVFR
jgi:putative flippase GtrA